MIEKTKKDIEELNAIENATGVDFRKEEDIIDATDRSILKENYSNPVIVVKYLCRDNPDLVRNEEDELLYKYNGKHYDLLTEKNLDSMILNFCIKYNVSKAFKSVTLILRALSVYPDVPVIEKMNFEDNLICLNNGILNIYTKELIPHSLDHYFDYCLAINYDKDAKSCPVFIKFLKDIFSNDKATMGNAIRLGGYLLDTSCKAKKCFFFDGNGGSGKSTLVDTYTMFFPKKKKRPVVTSLSLDALSKNSFDTADLIYSRFNQCAETKKGYYDSEFLKLMVTGDLITVRRIYSEPFTFRYKGKVVLLGNGLPKFNDTSDGMSRRILIFTFPNQYKEQNEIDKIKFADKRHIFKVDTEIPEKIEDEASSILNLFIEGLIELRSDNYKFLESKKSEKAMIDFKRDGDTVREFLEDNYEIDFKSKVPLLEIFGDFRSWYMTNVQDTKSMKFRSAEMGKRIKEVFGLDSLGRVKFLNKDTKKYQLLTAYNLRAKDEEEEEEPLNSIIEEIDDKDELTLRLTGK